MTVIIGAGTTVTSNLITSGFVSVSFSVSPSVERLFQLGSFDPFDVNIQTQESISISNFGGTSTKVALAPSTSCTDSTARMDVTITPAPCTGSTTPIVRTGPDALFINSFSALKVCNIKPTVAGAGSFSVAHSPFKGWGVEDRSLKEVVLVTIIIDLPHRMELKTGKYNYW